MIRVGPFSFLVRGRSLPLDTRRICCHATAAQFTAVMTSFMTHQVSRMENFLLRWLMDGESCDHRSLESKPQL